MSSSSRILQSPSLRELKAPDNPDYTFQEPGTGYDEMEENCSHCHTDFVRDFWTSKHSESASNPLLHDLYNGVTRLLEPPKSVRRWVVLGKSVWNREAMEM